MLQSLLAQNFWDTQDYRQWTADEVSRLTSDSPWVKKLNDLTITWLTALPIKQAMLKDRMEAGGILAENAQQIMTVEEKVYVIVITGLSAEQAQNLSEISLKVEGKPIIKPASGNLQNRGQTVEAVVIFPRTEPIIADDGKKWKSFSRSDLRKSDKSFRLRTWFIKESWSYSFHDLRRLGSTHEQHPYMA